MARWTAMAERAKRELLAARAFLAAVAEPPAPALAGFVAERGPCRAVGCGAEE
ncbi:hypothetical protein [Saccharopolyspora hattusasensis]|uniref:hypothetical protein n=1 Tax=Saccharopolyspora hattusasensis TaxID=1128679 RepID=UPI003D97CDCA